MKYIFLLTFLYSNILISFEKVSYSFSHDPIDVVIPCHPKDSATLSRTISSIRENVIGVRRIIVVSAQKFIDDAEWFDESYFPFTKESIAREACKSEALAYQELHKPKTRVGWLYQQFIKLYAAFCIPDISSNVLVVDADVIFLKPIEFLQENGAGLYAVGSEYHAPYFSHAKKVLPGLEKVYKNYSGIVHHMLFQKEVLEDFFNAIYAHHFAEPWIVMARFIEITKRNTILGSAISEYEMYFNFVFSRTDQVKIRSLKWGNVHEGEIEKYKKLQYDYIAIHKRIS